MSRAESEKPTVQRIPIDLIDPSPFNEALEKLLSLEARLEELEGQQPVEVEVPKPKIHSHARRAGDA